MNYSAYKTFIKMGAQKLKIRRDYLWNLNNFQKLPQDIDHVYPTIGVNN